MSQRILERTLLFNIIYIMRTNLRAQFSNISLGQPKDVLLQMSGYFVAKNESKRKLCGMLIASDE